jgi:hypothetical protein
MTKEIDKKLVEEARGLFARMIQERDKDKRIDLKIEINDICLRGKFDYMNQVYQPMVKSMKNSS